MPGTAPKGDKPKGDKPKGDKQEERRGPGRPKGALNRPKMPDDPESPRGEKPPPDMRDPEQAAKVTAKRLGSLIRECRRRDPDKCAHWQDPEILFRKKGVPVKKSAWRPFVETPVRGIEWLFGVKNPEPKSPRVSDEEIDEAAGYWEDASTHLGFGEAGAAWIGAVAGTVNTIGKAIVRGVVHLFSDDEEKKEAPPPGEQA